MILENGILSSTVLEDFRVVHGFTTQAWGNLGFGKRPNDPEVIANRKKLFETLHLDRRIHIQTRQTHSDICIHAANFSPGCEADACTSSSPQHLLSVLTADCVPVLLYHPEGIVAVIHAGWRGLYNDIIPKTVARLPSQPACAVGPAIGPCCYEVSEELASEFVVKFGRDVVLSVQGKSHLDLTRVALLQLQAAGVEEVEAAHLCTSCHPDLFFSYRRDGSSGRMMAYIGLGSSAEQ